jgi:hypothetical protein
MKNDRKQQQPTLKEALFLADFINENMKSGKLTSETNEQVESLWNQYKLSEVKEGRTIINADFGVLGSLVLRKIINADKEYKLEYKSGSYDYISVKCSTRRILWTDYSKTEPYNRQGGLYCDGASFEGLGSPVKETPEYREFDATDKYTSNITFGVWGYKYNDFYGSILFGLCIKNELVKEFIEKLRQIIKK